MISEFELIERYFKRPNSPTSAVLGIGDDCALLPQNSANNLAITSDMLIEGTHFLENADAQKLGWKALAVNLSDLAAMGAKPRFVTLALALPKANEAWIAAFSKGFFACANTFNVALIGGDTTKSSKGLIAICITALGDLPKNEGLCRGNAQENDEIWVSGNFGRAALGLWHLQGKIKLPENCVDICVEAMHKPVPRVELGLMLRTQKLANAAIDISDGLLADLAHIARASKLCAQVYENALPDFALFSADFQGEISLENLRKSAREAQLSGGDDYELIFTAKAAQHNEILSLANILHLPITCIGKMLKADENAQQTQQTQQAPVILWNNAGQNITPAHLGFDHFA